MPNVGPKLNETEYLFDNVARTGVFGLLCWLAWRAFGASEAGGLNRGPVRWAWAFTALYAAIDEAPQAFVPGRTATLCDWLADVAGATLVAVALSLWVRQGRWRRGA